MAINATWVKHVIVSLNNTHIEHAMPFALRVNAKWMVFAEYVCFPRKRAINTNLKATGNKPNQILVQNLKTKIVLIKCAKSLFLNYGVVAMNMLVLY